MRAIFYKCRVCKGEFKRFLPLLETCPKCGRMTLISVKTQKNEKIKQRKK